MYCADYKPLKSMLASFRFFAVLWFAWAFLWSNNSVAMTNRQIIYTFIENALKEELSDESIVIDFKLENGPELLKLSKQQKQIEKVELIDFALNNSKIEAKFYLYDGSSIFVNVIIVSFSKDFAATAKSIGAGKLIDSDDVNDVNVGLKKFNLKDYVTKEQVVGMQAKRRLPSGILIKKQDLVSPVIVKSGNMVNVIYQGSNIKLQSSVKAIQNGAAGDSIKLKTLDNKNMLLGTILDKDTVVIDAKN
jgi:flagella basal body P-ring formation protein FlgA